MRQAFPAVPPAVLTAATAVMEQLALLAVLPAAAEVVEVIILATAAMAARAAVRVAAELAVLQELTAAAAAAEEKEEKVLILEMVAKLVLAVMEDGVTQTAVMEETAIPASHPQMAAAEGTAVMEETGSPVSAARVAAEGTPLSATMAAAVLVATEGTEEPDASAGGTAEMEGQPAVLKILLVATEGTAGMVPAPRYRLLCMSEAPLILPEQ